MASSIHAVVNSVMAKHLIEYYPMLRDKSAASGAEWESVKKQLLKRLQNVTNPKKKQGATPSRKRPRRLSFQSSQEMSTDETGESTSSTLILERSPHSRCSTSEVEELDALAMMKALPDMFPSPVAPPKMLGHASEAMYHILESAEDPNTFLQTRPIFSPVMIVCETNCLLAIGTMPVVTFPKEDIYSSMMYLIGMLLCLSPHIS